MSTPDAPGGPADGCSSSNRVAAALAAGTIAAVILVVVLVAKLLG